ncbi:MAG: hypothetical protein V4534_07135 [Myxococcota bacterium]
MIHFVAALYVSAFALMLIPFITQKTGFETLDALEFCEAHLGIILSLFIFSMRPSWPTALIALLAIGVRALPRQKPGQMLKKSLVLLCVCAFWLQLSALRGDRLDFYQHIFG